MKTIQRHQWKVGPETNNLLLLIMHCNTFYVLVYYGTDWSGSPSGGESKQRRF